MNNPATISHRTNRHRSSLSISTIVIVMTLLVNHFCMAGEYLGNLTWPEAEQQLTRTPVVVIPFGAGFKEHGPHIPMNADAVVMQYLTDRAIAEKNVLVAPPVLHGWLPAFRDFPGSEVSDATVFIDYMTAVSESLIRSGSRRLLFLNLSISRASGLPISIVAREMRVRHQVPTLVLNWEDMETEVTEQLAEQNAGGHADEIETSINLYLQGDKVQMDKAISDERLELLKDYPGYRPGLLSRDPNDPAYSRTGQFGNATLATKEKGKQALDIMTEQLFKAIDGFSVEPLIDNH